MRGGAGNDRLAGSNGADILDGGAGNDELYGNVGADTLDGGAGDDRLDGHSGADTLDGGAGDDRLEGGDGADTLDGGDGEDAVSYAGSHAGVTVNLRTGEVSGGHATGDSLQGFEHIIGSEYTDMLIGDDGDNTIWGNGGADVLDGGDGEDTVSYDGSNRGVTVDLRTGEFSWGSLTGGSIRGFEHIIGSKNADDLAGDDGNNVIVGGAGDDWLGGGAGDDRLEGGDGNDQLFGGNDTDTLAGDDGDDRLEGGDGTDTLDGGNGNDRLFGGNGADILAGDDGNDRLEGGDGADTLDGGSGEDTVSYFESDVGVTVNLHTGEVSGGHATGDSIRGFENIRGSGGADTLTGDDADNVIEGGVDSDTLYGGAGADTLYGGAGADILDGGVGADTLDGGYGDDRLHGGAGADSLSGGDGADWLEGGEGADALDGGGDAFGYDIDTVSYAGSNAAVTVNLRTGEGSGGHATGDSIQGVERIIGSEYADILTGDDASNIIEGNGGADTLDGGDGADAVSYTGSNAGVTVNLDTGEVSGGHAAGDSIRGFENIIGSAYADMLTGDDADNVIEGKVGADTLDGGDGADILEGGEGADTLDGGSGEDTVSYFESDVGVTVNLHTGEVSGGHATGDSIRGFENIIGSAHPDVLTGDDGNNSIVGGAGDDRMEGGDGADTLDGGSGEDTVSYAGSNARVVVDLSFNEVSGGHAAGDRITGFHHIIGSEYADWLSGDYKDNVIEGNDGDDWLHGGYGADTLVGGYGADTLVGGYGADTLVGGDGDDWLDGGSGADTLDGGRGEDTISYTGSNAGVTVNLRTGAASGGHATGDSIRSIEHIIGSTYADTLTGDDGDNLIEGRGGADTLDGGDGKDTVSYFWSYEGVTVNLRTGEGTGGHAEGDSIRGIERIIGSRQHADTLIGDDVNNVIMGEAGDDRLEGGGGDDELYGGHGADIFMFAPGHGNDIILDFSDGEDRIDLSELDIEGLDAVTIIAGQDRVTLDLTDYGGGTVELPGIDRADLDASDFLF